MNPKMMRRLINYFLDGINNPIQSNDSVKAEFCKKKVDKNRVYTANAPPSLYVETEGDWLSEFQSPVNCYFNIIKC